MGSFDCYCVLCSGPLSIFASEFGSRKGKALRKRRLRVERYKRKLAGEHLNVSDVESGDEDEEMEDAPDHEALERARIEQREQEDDDADLDYEYSSDSSSSYAESVDSRDLHTEFIPDCNIRPRTPSPEPEEEIPNDNWSQASDLTIDERWQPFEERDEAASMYSYNEKNAYDPAIMQIKDIRWLDRCRASAFNPSAGQTGKGYISGRGRYSDYGSFDIKKPGTDPNDTGEAELNCTSYNEEEHVSFPWHEACFEILAKSLGCGGWREVDKDLLYWVFKTSMDDERGSLGLEYALESECGQFWECLPGEEYSVCDPSPRPEFEQELQNMLPASLFGTVPASPDLSSKVRNDPFNVLPYDVLLDIFERVETKDMLSLMKASHHVNTTTRENAFWKHMLRIRVLPWLYELRPLVETAASDTIDYKGLFLWIDDLTRPEFGNQGPMIGMAVANRRRIWSAVQDLVPLYKSRVAPPTPVPENAKEARAIADSALCLHMPMTLFPQPSSPVPISALFIKAWNEIGHAPCDFDTYWARKERLHYPVLVGVSVTFGGQERVFGSTEGQKGNPLHIEAGLWIRQIQLQVDEVDMFYHSVDRSQWKGMEDVMPRWDACVIGMEVKLSNGKKKGIKSNHRGNWRPLEVLEDMHLVGLTGEIAPNGAISRLGLLQAARPDSAPVVLPTCSSAQQLLWNTRNAYLPDDQSFHTLIWTHSTAQHYLFPPSTAISPFDPPADMIPHDLSLWANSPEHLDTVRPIECFQPTDASGDATIPGSFPSAPSPSPIPDIVGLRPGAHNAYGGRGGTVGQGGPVPFQHPEWHRSSRPLQAVFEYLWEKYPISIDNTRLFNPEFTQIFHIDSTNGEKITQVHVSHDYRALKFVTNHGREVVFGEKGKEEWHRRVAAEDEVFLGLSTAFGKLSGWSEGMKMWSHMRLSGLGVVFVRVNGKGKVRVKGKGKGDDGLAMR